MKLEAGHWIAQCMWGHWCPCDEWLPFKGEDENWIEFQESMETEKLHKVSIDSFLRGSVFGQEKNGVVAVEKPELR